MNNKTLEYTISEEYTLTLKIIYLTIKTKQETFEESLILILYHIKLF